MNNAYLESCCEVLSVLYVVDIPHPSCVFEIRVSFWNSSKSETFCVAQAGTELKIFLPHPPNVLGLQSHCTTMPSIIFLN